MHHPAPVGGGQGLGDLDPEPENLVGSWNASTEEERVRSTALLAMCLEVYYRYDKVFGQR